MLIAIVRKRWESLGGEKISNWISDCLLGQMQDEGEKKQ